LEHFGQSVLFDVSIIFLRSAVLAILAMAFVKSPQKLGLRTRLYVRRNPAAGLGEIRSLITQEGGNRKCHTFKQYTEDRSEPIAAERLSVPGKGL
jgi:hypothetical protein